MQQHVHNSRNIYVAFSVAEVMEEEATEVEGVQLRDVAPITLRVGREKFADLVVAVAAHSRARSAANRYWENLPLKLVSVQP